MWGLTFEKRLKQWCQLRDTATALPESDRLLLINDWWFQTPWIPYHLHWDDQLSWPDPWQLLEDNIFCPVARSLGIMYTLMMIDSAYQYRAFITRTDQTDLVLVDEGKYILNWEPGLILNIALNDIVQQRKLRNDVLYQKIG